VNESSTQLFIYFARHNERKDALMLKSMYKAKLQVIKQRRNKMKMLKVATLSRLYTVLQQEDKMTCICD